ncbi:MAG: hypothetical protein ACR2GA_00710 [Chloroflexota bacterium]
MPRHASWRHVLLLLALPLAFLIPAGRTLAHAGPRRVHAVPYWQVIVPHRAAPLFHQGAGIAVDRAGDVYIADPLEQRVKKFSTQGKLLASWGSDGPGPLPWSPLGVAVDAHGTIYVLAGDVFKLSPQGRILSHWSASAATAIAVGGSGNVFVLSPGDNSAGSGQPKDQKARIDKYAPSGKLMSTWQTPAVRVDDLVPDGLIVDSRGNVYASLSTASCPPPCPLQTTEIYHFTSSGRSFTVPHPSGVTWGPVAAADGRGDVYLTPATNDVGRVEKISDAGKLLAVWGTGGFGHGPLGGVLHLALGDGGRVYLADSHNADLPDYATSGVIHILSPAGQPLAQWGSDVAADPFQLGFSLVVNPAGSILSTGGANNAAYTVFSTNGRVQHTFGSAGRPHDQLYDPEAIALDSQGNVYLTDDIGGRIAKYSPAGTLLAEWTLLGPDDGLLSGLALDRAGNIYTLAKGRGQIIKLSTKGKVLARFATRGSGDGQLMGPTSLAVDAHGDIVVADTYNNRIERFSPTGHFLATWPIISPQPDSSNRPIGLTLDATGNVYVAEMPGRIEEFSPAGKLLAGWGEEGIQVGELSQPSDVALDAHGNVFVADEGNNRIQELVRHL